MSYFRKPNPKSTWKRPKPKIYDCNTRDLEKFYQDSYGEYLNNKSDIRSRELDRERRGDAEQLTRRFEQRRAASLVYGEDDSPRQHNFVPARQTSNEGRSSEHSYLRTRLENSMNDGPRDTTRSTSSATRNVSFSGVLNADDSNSEMASIETRLERLRKLREELGLPAESGGASSSANTSSSTYTSTEKSSRRVQSPPTETRESSRWTSQGTSVRSDNRSRASPTRPATDCSSYSSRTEKVSSMRNGIDDNATSYTSRTARNAGGVTNGIGSSSYESSSTSSRNRKRVEKPSLDGIDMDDDELLADMRKKFPSSNEILEKIRNMDID